MNPLAVLSGKHSSYIIAVYNNTYILGRFGKDAVPDPVSHSVFAARELYHHRYTRGRYEAMHSTVMRYVSQSAVIRSLKQFNCFACNRVSRHVSIPFCLHPMCSECVADYEHKSDNCPMCDESMEKSWSGYSVFGIPVSHLIRIIRGIDEPIQYINSL